MFRNSKAPTLIFVTLSMLLASGSLATPTAEAQKVITAWSSAFSEGNLELILRSFAEDALFLGTGSKGIVSTPAGIRKYFEAALEGKGPKPLVIKLLDQKEIVLADGSVLVVALDSIAGTAADG